MGKVKTMVDEKVEAPGWIWISPYALRLAVHRGDVHDVKEDGYDSDLVYRLIQSTAPNTRQRAERAAMKICKIVAVPSVAEIADIYYR